MPKKEYSLSVEELDAIKRIQEDYCKKQKQKLIEEFLSDIPKLSRTELIKKYYKMLEERRKE